MTKRIFAFGRVMEESSLKHVDIVKVTRPETEEDNKIDVVTSLVVMPDAVARFVADLAKQGLINFNNLGIISVVDATDKIIGFKFWIPDKEYIDPKYQKMFISYYNTVNPFIVKMDKEKLPYGVLKMVVPESMMIFGVLTCAAQFVNPENNLTPDPEGVIEMAYFRKMAETIWEKYTTFEVTKSNLHLPFVNGTDPYGLKMKFIEQIAKFMTLQTAIQGQIKWDWQRTEMINYMSSHLKKWNDTDKYWDYLNPPFPEKKDE
jgi:hypothetical protein